MRRDTSRDTSSDLPFVRDPDEGEESDLPSESSRATLVDTIKGGTGMARIPDAFNPEDDLGAGESSLPLVAEELKPPDKKPAAPEKLRVPPPAHLSGVVSVEEAERQRRHFELDRVTAEGNRAKAEESRRGKELDRIGEEVKRRLGEGDREDAERKRAEAEGERAASEAVRATSIMLEVAKMKEAVRPAHRALRVAIIASAVSVLAIGVAVLTFVNREVTKNDVSRISDESADALKAAKETKAAAKKLETETLPQMFSDNNDIIVQRIQDHVAAQVYNKKNIEDRFKMTVGEDSPLDVRIKEIARRQKYDRQAVNSMEARINEARRSLGLPVVDRRK